MSTGRLFARKRRLVMTGGLMLVAGLLYPANRAGGSLTAARRDWRYCTKCHVLFYSANKANSCAGGDTHAAQGYEFEIDLDAPETPTRQANWRCCRKCQAMFFNGYPDKGRCPAGGAHAADSSARYALPHSMAAARNAQKDWRFCNKCHAMFFNGYADKGRCPGGAGHVAQGYNFVLRHFV